MFDDPKDAVPGTSAPGRKPPPRGYQFRAGESGNPRGRPANAGQSIKEAWNKLAAGYYTAAELLQIARDENVEATVRVAARELLQAVEPGDLADFEDYTTGQASLAELRARGVNTALLKKAKRKATQVLANGGEDDGKNVEIEFTAEIELHDRSGTSLDRIMDRTDGRPIQAVRVAADTPAEANPTVARGVMKDPAFRDVVRRMLDQKRQKELAARKAAETASGETSDGN